MSIFEDLIEELKEENLLEETVIEVGKTETANLQAAETETEIIEEVFVAEEPEDNHFETETGDNHFQIETETKDNHFQIETKAEDNYFQTETFELKKVSLPEIPVAKIPSLEQNQFQKNEEIYFTEQIKFQDGQVLFGNGQLSELSDIITGSNRESGLPVKPETNQPEAVKVKKPPVEKDYFRSRAMEEVTGLQMVDHVLSGVEREQMKIAPKPYDELPVKLALHDFMQITQNSKSAEHAQAEFRLMQETESWYSSLSHRDKHITIAHLRRYCETTRPVLSAQALISLARFYRNSPYSEQVRGKFDLIVTRLFSKDIDNDKREQLFSRDELILQLKELYADWSSIQLYSADEEDSDILITTLKFEDFLTEAETAESFEELVKNDFFNRLRMFKESCQENFFAPLVTATAIESNIKIGNRYIDLLEKEKENSNSASLEEKYGFLHDQAISDATGKTLQLVELLRGRTENNTKEVAEIVEIKVKAEGRTPYKPLKKQPRSRFWGINKWLLGFTIFTILACVGLYIWAEYQTQDTKDSAKVKKVNLDNSSLKEYLQTARITDDTFYGITLPSWENMNNEKKEEFLKKILSIGGEKGFKKVHLINEAGKSVGFASAEKVEVYNR